jgi:hypothetical protein
MINKHSNSTMRWRKNLKAAGWRQINMLVPNADIADTILAIRRTLIAKQLSKKDIRS